MSEPVVQTEKLTKKYGNFVAVDRLTLTIQPGEVFGLLGPNGAGKTTTILMLLGLTEPTYGMVRVLGMDPSRQPLKVKSRVGYLPDQVGFYDDLSAYENLAYIARLNGLSGETLEKRANEALARVGLAEVAHNRVGTFSRGMRQRLGVAEVLIKQPQLIIMDEPTSGLDPEATHELLDTIRSLKAEGITLLISSHLLHQVQEVCDRVGLFSRGKMVLEGSVDELALRVLGGAYRIQVNAEGERQAILQALEKVPGLSHVRAVNEHLYAMEAARDLRPEVAQAVIAAGARLYRLDVQAQSLDDIYTAYFKEVENDPNRSTSAR